MEAFNIVEASIDDHRRALNDGVVTSVQLVVMYLLRIAKYDIKDGLHAFTLINNNVLEEARFSDERRASGLSPRPLEGIPYTLKDSYKYAGLTVTNGSPALEGLMSSEDSYVAFKLREAGAVLLGKTNMPPMAAGGMQRGLYGRAESPYNRDYLTGAFSSGSSNGAATSTAASLATFGMASETVSSGRSPASNNGLVAYTPSRGIISCRGLWPLYVTCDVPVPYARSVKDMIEIVNIIAEPDPITAGDFWRHQPHIQLPPLEKPQYQPSSWSQSLSGKRIAVPKRYIGGVDSHPNAKASVVSAACIETWQQARADLEALGATVIETDFPLVSNYEDDSVSGEANNVQGAPEWWNSYERGALCAKAWDDFLIANNDPRLNTITAVNPHLLFPKPPNYKPDHFLERKNWIDYASLPTLAQSLAHQQPIHSLPGTAQTLPALEAQRKRDLEAWLDLHAFACVVFPAQGDVGPADLEFNLESARAALRNGVKYSHGNRALRHLGVPTVSVPMGTLADRGNMPINLTFAGRAYEDEELLRYAYAFEQWGKRRVAPAATPALPTDTVTGSGGGGGGGAPGFVSNTNVMVTATAEKLADGHVAVAGTVSSSDVPGDVGIIVYFNGQASANVNVNIEDGQWAVTGDQVPYDTVRLDWSLKPMKPPPIMVLVVAQSQGRTVAAKLLWV
ncbi:uncharacterized protein HMPREF1541_08933 [Cyphellophora europaea CBS 101466]|uniref:Amidase domain-containing protein n=1 Tax=Cyphellophora europaea (strain CBS 101466) TaxID=1220924 RepID=W2RJY3_CYPE1|nr:uncharacterized protein HMPREF1541_08933 [Cyphellophora europaea CBS 101466]ETN36655.1 hypothetical protein HMPREF1541_08933 [Cyphellophora europaea CBS 101466]